MSYTPPPPDEADITLAAFTPSARTEVDFDLAPPPVITDAGSLTATATRPLQAGTVAEATDAGSITQAAVDPLVGAFPAIIVEDTGSLTATAVSPLAAPTLVPPEPPENLSAEFV